MPVLKVGGRVLLCTPADLPRQLEPAGVPRTSDPDSDGEMVFIVVQAPSNTSHPADTNDKTPPKEPRSQDGQPGADAAALGESGEGTSRVLRMNLPSGRRAQHVFVHEACHVRCRSRAHTSVLGGGSVLREGMRALLWHWYFCSCSLVTKAV